MFFFKLPRAERDDPAHWIVGGDADRHAVSGYYLDSEPPHAAAKLGEYLVALVALYAVETAAVHRHHRALNVNQIVLTQLF